MTRDALVCWVIFDRPSDFPAHCVVRRHLVRGGDVVIDPVGCLCGSLEEARAQVPAGLVRFLRDRGDALSIVETWI